MIENQPHSPAQSWPLAPTPACTQARLEVCDAEGQGAGGLGGADPAAELERYRPKAWIEAAKKRLHHNVLAIALANKSARIAQAVLNKERYFEVTRTTAPPPQPA